MCTSVAATAQATRDDDNASEHSTLPGASPATLPGVSPAKRFVYYFNIVYILAIYSI